MNSIANATQYPISCSQCHRMTAFSAAVLLNAKEISCRHCQHTIPIDKRIIRSVEKTLKDMSNYVEKREPSQPLDNTETNDTSDTTNHSLLPDTHDQTPPPSSPTVSTNPPRNAQTKTSPSHNNRRTSSRRNRKSKRKNRQPALAGR